MSNACHPFKPDEEIILYEALSSEDTEATDSLALVLTMSDEDDEDDDEDEDGCDDHDSDSAACDEHGGTEYWSEDECAVIKAFYENEDDEDEDMLRVPSNPPKLKRLVHDTPDASQLSPSTEDSLTKK